MSVQPILGTLKYTITKPGTPMHRSKAKQFFYDCCRCVPEVLQIYRLDELLTPRQMRMKIADKIREYSHITDPIAIDVLIIKGEEELGNCVKQFKQRHHMMTEYADYARKPDLIKKESKESLFLNNFFESNYKQRITYP